MAYILTGFTIPKAVVSNTLEETLTPMAESLSCVVQKMEIERKVSVLQGNPLPFAATRQYLHAQTVWRPYCQLKRCRFAPMLLTPEYNSACDLQASRRAKAEAIAAKLNSFLSVQ